MCLFCEGKDIPRIWLGLELYDDWNITLVLIRDLKRSLPPKIAIENPRREGVRHYANGDMDPTAKFVIEHQHNFMIFIIQGACLCPTLVSASACSWHPLAPTLVTSATIDYSEFGQGDLGHRVALQSATPQPLT